MSQYEENVNKAKNVLHRHSENIKQTYLVVGIGIGFKVEKGKLTDKIALQFYVKKKKSKEELSSEGITPIPKEIEGFTTDIIEISEGFKPRL